MVYYTGNFLLGLTTKAHRALPLQGRELQAWIWAPALPAITCTQLIVGDSLLVSKQKHILPTFPKTHNEEIASGYMLMGIFQVSWSQRKIQLFKSCLPMP